MGLRIWMEEGVKKFIWTTIDDAFGRVINLVDIMAFSRI